jgi:hypothetical protein
MSLSTTMTLVALLLLGSFLVVTKADEYIIGLHTCKVDEDCLNGGVCTKYNLISTIPHFCDCPPPYKGDNCAEQECYLQCQAGGTCHVVPVAEDDFDEICECPAGRSGHLCQYDVNDPAAHLHTCDTDDDCQNGGECKEPEDYSVSWEFEDPRYCDCPTGFGGDSCEEVVVPVDNSSPDPSDDPEPSSDPPPEDESPPGSNDPLSEAGLPQGAKIGLGVGVLVSLLVLGLVVWTMKRSPVARAKEVEDLPHTETAPDPGDDMESVVDLDPNDIDVEIEKLPDVV